MSDTLTREDIETIRNFAAEPCECVSGKVCGPCKAREWIEAGAKLAEELS